MTDPRLPSQLQNTTTAPRPVLISYPAEGRRLRCLGLWWQTTLSTNWTWQRARWLTLSSSLADGVLHELTFVLLTDRISRLSASTCISSHAATTWTHSPTSTCSSTWPPVICCLSRYVLSPLQVKVGFFYSTTYAAMSRPAMLYNRRMWLLIGKSQWCWSAMLRLQHTPPPQSTKPGFHPVSIHQMAPPVRGSKHPITAYYSVYWSWKDERLSRPGTQLWYAASQDVHCHHYRYT